MIKANSTEHLKCVFDLGDCPVRATFKKGLEVTAKLDKIIKPIGDAEMLKIFMPIIDKLKEVQSSEFSLLHYYCAFCPILRAKLESIK